MGSCRMFVGYGGVLWGLVGFCSVFVLALVGGGRGAGS